VNLLTAEKFRVLRNQAGSMMTDPISDMLTRIRNASMVRKSHVEAPHSKIKFAIAKILQANGYVASVEVKEEGVRKMVRIGLSYDANRNSKISSITRISTPGRRVYKKASEISRVRSGLGMAIVSTPNGLMTNDEARKRRLGGEIICEVY